MFTGVKVIPKEDFDAWISDTSQVVPVTTSETSLADQGWEVLRRNGCNACHSNDGSKLVGPSYKGVWGHTTTVVTGGQKREITADAEYIKRSIFDPNADVVEGFNKGLMLSYEGMVTEQEVELIIEYLKSLDE
jgi:cytochrome c oxidase subunit 2